MNFCSDELFLIFFFARLTHSLMSQGVGLPHAGRLI